MLNGIYLGVVEKVGDPEQLGRLKVRVPGVYGLQGAADAIPVDDLPWALPMGLPAGGSNASGGFSMLPEVNDQVAVQFLDGEPEKPTWQWLMQSQPQAKELKLHQYTAKKENNQDVAGTAARAVWTRYGHSVEIRPEHVVVTTKEGQQIVLQTSESSSGGSAALQTPKGQSLRLSDVSETALLQALEGAVISGKKVIINAPTSVMLKTGRYTLMVGSTLIAVQGSTITLVTGTGASIVVDAEGNVALTSASGAAVSLEDSKIQVGTPDGTGLVLENGKVSVNAKQMVINTTSMAIGTAQGSPVILMTSQALTWFLAHTHSNGNNGSPTGPPILTFPSDAISQMTHSS